MIRFFFLVLAGFLSFISPVMSQGNDIPLIFNHATSPQNPRVGQPVTIIISSTTGALGDWSSTTWTLQYEQQEPIAFPLISSAPGSWQFTPQRPGNYTFTYMAPGAANETSFDVNITAALSLQESSNRLLDDPYRKLKGDTPLVATPANLPQYSAEDSSSTFIVRLLKRLAESLVEAAAAVSIVILVIAGGNMVLALGNPDGWSAAKRTIRGVGMGLVLIMASYVIVKTVVQLAFIGESVSDPNQEITECEGPTAAALADVDRNIFELETAMNVKTLELSEIDLWWTQANNLYDNFKGTSWITTDTATLNEVSDVITAMNASRNGLIPAIRQIEGDLATVRDSYNAVKAECIVFTQQDVLEQRAVAVNTALEQLDIEGRIATLSSARFTATYTEVKDGFIALVGDTCSGKFNEDSGALLYKKLSTGDIRRACEADWDADGVTNDDENDTGRDFTNPLDGGVGILSEDGED